MRTTPTSRPADPDAPKEAVQAASRPTDWFRRPAIIDCGVALAFLALAAWVGHGLWPDPTTRELLLNPEDQILIEWFLAVDVQVLFGDQGFVTDRLNAPAGMNMLANATSLTLGLLLAPITLTAGAPVSFAVLTVGNLAATAFAWYLLFARTLGTHRVVAAVAGAFCGFAPAMISHSNSHWHMSAQWLVPPIIWSVIRLTRAAEAGHHRRIITSGLWLAALVVVQYFLGAEVLYLAALTLAIYTVWYALSRRAWARQILLRFLGGLAVATAAAGAVLAYPLWVQVAGPGSVPDGPFSPYYYSADLLSWPAFSPLSLAGSERTASLATGPAEYNTFLGAPLLLLALGCVIWLRRTPHRPVVAAAAGTSLIMGVLALGPELIVGQTRMSIPLPYVALVDVRVIDGALPQRYALAVVPMLALLLALTLERARQLPGPQQLTWASIRANPARYAAPVAVAVALLPLWPTPLPATERPLVPEFISGGHWRECVAPGRVLVPVPLPTPAEPQPMRWAAAANAEFGLPEGFFIGPYGRGGSASMGTAKLPTSALLAEVAATGRAPQLGPAEQAQAAADLAFWGAQCVAVDPLQPHQAELRATLAGLLDHPGEQIADTWVWRL